jgi:hypothetical protein
MRSRSPSGEGLPVPERGAAPHSSHEISRMREQGLEEMAKDPAIRRELREIEAEFAATEFDGLETCS